MEGRALRGRGRRRAPPSRFVFLLDQSKLGAFVEFAVIKFPAAIQAGHSASMPADPWKILSAAGTLVKVASSAALDRERQGVGARFVTDTKVTAGLSPFQAVGRQAAPARAELGQEMRQLVA